MIAASFDHLEARLAGERGNDRSGASCRVGHAERGSGPAAASGRTPRRLRVTVAGGGPVGLVFALTANELLGASVDVTVFDGRWADCAGAVTWKGESEGNRRRDQVVTLQSGVSKDLPRAIERALFGSDDFSAVWPYGRNSPRERGRPRNIRIRDIEDRLLDMARGTNIRLVPERYEPEGRDLGCEVLAICDGASSPTRERFAAAFGTPDPTPYLVDGKLGEDVILSLGVSTAIDPATAVVLTVAQNRFLLNTHGGRGVLNIRLMPEEARELGMIHLDRTPAQGCFPACGCALSRVEYAAGRGAYVCPRHRTTLKAALDGASPLWRRVREGLQLFEIAERDVHAVTAFRSSMTHRSRFTAEVKPAGAVEGGTFGFLLGDASGPIHVWPGRGLNHGLSTAVSLARCLKEKWQGNRLRHADFARHEANMHMLQYRHKGRAWRAMVRFDENGQAKLISDVMQDSQCGARFCRRDAITEMGNRLRDVAGRLAGRLDALPDEAALRARMETLDNETLAILVGSGAWETVGSGGEEVDVTRLFPDVADAQTNEADLPQHTAACRLLDLAAVA